MGFTGRLSRELQEMNVFMFWMLIILTFIIQYFFIRIDAAPSVYDIFPRNRHFNLRLTSEESEEQVQEKRKKCFCENNLCVIDKMLKCRRSVMLGDKREKIGENFQRLRKFRIRHRRKKSFRRDFIRLLEKKTIFL